MGAARILEDRVEAEAIVQLFLLPTLHKLLSLPSYTTQDIKTKGGFASWELGSPA